VAESASAQSFEESPRHHLEEERMSIDLRRRNLVLASAAAGALAPLGFTRSAAASTHRLASVPTVDSLTIRVITDSSYDTPKVGNRSG
jgi:hypothetical protein